MAKKLERLSDAEITDVARKMFLGGLPCLPFLWIIAAVWLYPSVRERGPRVPQLRQYHMYCIIGAVLWFIATTTWYAIFVNRRLDWGETGDRLTVVLIKGV
ncbi:gamma-secretase subunit PEN-2-like protein [Syncephalis pseudoplumigaleata]|uniref:Gamma-secretase subunit PEN-2-like protein n=1 Tax=Syncephalis pseudoplumigaleata TaxID=1712513 RepID=A0A4P9YSJ2_9FUNG|nr:gamma-secretase subunit PEN-2-like protein [Syncephalis pseudoplumigaleata]|eukprot:RKP22638.1 gamma-secretase subunit PEN-2-like protein [Syncephalis pseudoplumigaleata]